MAMAERQPWRSADPDKSSVRREQVYRMSDIEASKAVLNRDGSMLLKPDLAEAIISEVRESEIIQMACDLINIPSPTGEELQMGNHMRAALQAAGIKVSSQEVEPGRANIVGLWEGEGNGKSLMFNGHMDTSNSGREEYLTGLGKGKLRFAECRMSANSLTHGCRLGKSAPATAITAGLLMWAAYEPENRGGPAVLRQRRRSAWIFASLQRCQCRKAAGL